VLSGQGQALTLSGPAIAAAFIAQLLVMFALCYVVLNVATSKDHPDNSFYGLAIGFTVAAGAVAVGPVSGGAFNTAVVFAGVTMGMFAPSTLWVYLVAQMCAGIAAGFTFCTLNPADK
jgi:aquaporin Z